MCRDFSVTYWLRAGTLSGPNGCVLGLGQDLLSVYRVSYRDLSVMCRDFAGTYWVCAGTLLGLTGCVSGLFRNLLVVCRDFIRFTVFVP